MRKLLLIVVFLCLAGCVPYAKDIRTETVVGINADISFYKSYAWLETISALNDPGGQWQPPGFDIASDIRMLIDGELQSRGLQLSNAPEITVSFQLSANMQALKLTKNPVTEQDVLVNVPDASLMVVLSEAGTGNIIWISKGDAEIHQNLEAEQIRKRIAYTITEMFKSLDKRSWF